MVINVPLCQLCSSRCWTRRDTQRYERRTQHKQASHESCGGRAGNCLIWRSSVHCLLWLCHVVIGQERRSSWASAFVQRISVRLMSLRRVVGPQLLKLSSVSRIARTTNVSKLARNYATQVELISPLKPTQFGQPLFPSHPHLSTFGRINVLCAIFSLTFSSSQRARDNSRNN